jgi:hypothetical protein
VEVFRFFILDEKKPGAIYFYSVVNRAICGISEEDLMHIPRTHATRTSGCHLIGGM